jgi:2-oxoglutarate ferredoxin oxidoreductase subunit gamma
MSAVAPSSLPSSPRGIQEVVLAGFGGQGILLAGRLLASAAMRRGLNVLVHNYYEGFVRGGVSECTVALSTENIDSPVRPHPAIVAALDRRALASWIERVRAGGLLIRNRSVANSVVSRTDIEVFDMPASELAAEAGSPMSVSMTVVGALASLTGWFTLENCIAALDEVVPAHRRNLLAINEGALRRGASFAADDARSILNGSR